jgi:hypothetical protein
MLPAIYRVRGKQILSSIYRYYSIWRLTGESLEQRSASLNIMLPDDPIINAEQFGFLDYSRLLASIVCNKNLSTPFTIAIHGGWGAGKTSLMRTIQTRVESTSENANKVKCIWFSAWEFERLSTPLWSVFLNRIIMDLEDMYPKEKFTTVKAVGKAVLLLASNYALKKTLSASKEDIEEIKDALWTDIQTVKCLQEQLSTIIEGAMTHDLCKRQRIVIFIDDLDRCLPDTAVEIFESIKLFLSCPKCVFIVGVDKSQLRRAFANKFGQGSDGAGYVEKFVQLEFDLPRKTSEEVKAYLVEVAPQKLQRNETILDLISKSIEPNPRKIKRWLNALFFLEGLLSLKKEETPDEAVNEELPSIWLFIKSFFADFSERVENDPSFLNLAIKLTKGKCSNDEKEKMKDVVFESKLTAFLSNLNGNYDERYLRLVVYLSKTTTAMQTKNNALIDENEIIKHAEDFKLSLVKLDDESKIKTAYNIIGALGCIRDSEESWAKRDLYINLDLILTSMFQNTLRNQILEKLLDLMLRNYFAERFFYTKISTYTASTSLLWTSLTEGVIDKLIQLFRRTGQNELIEEYSTALENFNTYFNSEQIYQLCEATISNSKITPNRSLNTIFSFYKRRLGRWQKQIEGKGFDINTPQKIMPENQENR